MVPIPNSQLQQKQQIENLDITKYECFSGDPLPKKINTQCPLWLMRTLVRL